MLAIQRFSSGNAHAEDLVIAAVEFENFVRAAIDLLPDGCAKGCQARVG
jgi:hypothetical protein